VAKFNKKRARELKQDAFRDKTFGLLNRVGATVEGNRMPLLYGLGAICLIGVVFTAYSWWSNRRTEEARKALGAAIEIARAQVTPSPPDANTLTFTSEKDKAKRAVEEFQRVASNYGSPYKEKALYMMAVHQLTLDRNRGLKQLEELTNSGSEETSAWAKFALAQEKEADGDYNSAVKLYKEIAEKHSEIIPSETARLRVALIAEKQGNRKEAVDMLFQIVESGRKSRAQEKADSRSTPTSAEREASQKLETLDPDRFAKLPAETGETTPG
jgi:hypothetical protein